jgi:hypothetical protein
VVVAARDAGALDSVAQEIRSRPGRRALVQAADLRKVNVTCRKKLNLAPIRLHR